LLPNAVKNSVDLKKNIIITGPNASGKTTYLKTTAINIILSQQFSCGFYKKCVVNPFQEVEVEEMEEEVEVEEMEEEVEVEEVEEE
jgi:ABC-type molybdenum transport system ATPase subunit/photorepair protein PhrA